MTVSWRQDLFLRDLFPVKLLLFLQAAGDFAVYPFFTLHMKSLGISLTEIGIQFALTPIATLLATPVMGMVADRIGNFKVMLATALVLCAIMANFIVMIPKIQMAPQCSLNQETIKLTCPGAQSDSNSDPFLMDIPDCFQRNQSLIQLAVNSTTDNNQAMNYILLSDCYVDCFPKVSSRVRKYCLTDKSDKESSCYSFAPDAESDQFIRKHKFAIGLNVLKKDLNNGSKGIQARFYEVVSDFRFYKNITCRSLGCEIRCPIKPTTRLGEAYAQKNVQDPESKRFVFWSYLVARVALIVIISTEMALLKAAILTIVDRNDTEYGYQRVWSSLAAAAVPPLAGMLMDKLRASGDPDAYYPCFYVYSGFKVFMAAVALSVDMKCKTPSVEIWARVTQLIRNKEVAILLVFVTIIGSIWGFIETFIVWYLQELQASRTMIGLTFTISALSGIPFTIMAGWLQQKFGHVPILIIGLSAYSIRLLGYSYATTAYQVLALETLEGITSSLVIVIITTYSTVLSTHDLVATMQATWAALHFSVGRAIGSGTGGVLMDNLGPVVTYRIYAFVCVLSAMTYLVIYLRWLRKKELARRRDGNKDGKEDTGVKDLSLVAGDVHVGKNGEIIYSLKSSGKEDDGKEKQGVVNEAMDKTE